MNLFLANSNELSTIKSNLTILEANVTSETFFTNYIYYI